MERSRNLSKEPLVPVKSRRDHSEHLAQTSLQILEAATQEMAQRLYFDVSMRDIARRAGISTGLAYHYFASKEDLLTALIEHATGVWIDEFEQHMDDRRFDSLVGFITEYLMFMRTFIQETHPDIFRFYLKHITIDHLPQLDFFFDRVKRIDPHFARQIDAAIRRGEVRPDIDRKELAFLIEAVTGRLMEAFFSENLGMELGLTKMAENSARDKVHRLLSLFLGSALIDKK